MDTHTDTQTHRRNWKTYSRHAATGVGNYSTIAMAGTVCDIPVELRPELSRVKIDLNLNRLKIARLVTRTSRGKYSIVELLWASVRELQVRVGQTDGRTDGRTNAVRNEVNEGIA